MSEVGEGLVIQDLEAAKKNRERIEVERRKEQKDRVPATTPQLAGNRVKPVTMPTPVEIEVARPAPSAVVEPAPEVGGKPTSTRGTYKKGKYLDEHREELLADRLSIGLRATLKKWDIASSSYRYAEKRWRAEGYTIPTIQGVEGHRGGVHEHKPKEAKPEEVKEEGQVSTPLAETLIVPETGGVQDKPKNEGRASDLFKRDLSELKDNKIKSFTQEYRDLVFQYAKPELKEDAYYEVLFNNVTLEERSEMMSQWVKHLKTLPDCQHNRGAILVLETLRELYAHIDGMDPKENKEGDELEPTA